MTYNSMTYEEAAAYIEETPKFTKKNTLENTKAILRHLERAGHGIGCIQAASQTCLHYKILHAGLFNVTWGILRSI